MVSVGQSLRVYTWPSPQVVEKFTAHYVFALGLSRFISCAHWVLQIVDGDSFLLQASRLIHTPHPHPHHPPLFAHCSCGTRVRIHIDVTPTATARGTLSLVVPCSLWGNASSGTTVLGGHGRCHPDVFLCN